MKFTPSSRVRRRTPLLASRSGGPISEALFGLPADRLRTRVDRPLARAGSVEAGFARHDDAVRIRRERLSDQPLTRLVGRGRVDEVHAELESTAEDALARLAVGRL